VSVPPASSTIPFAIDPDGKAYIPAAAVSLFLRAIATCCRNLADDPEYTLADIADVLAQEADHRLPGHRTSPVTRAT
jgi:hypothetical protein